MNEFYTLLYSVLIWHALVLVVILFGMAHEHYSL